MNVSFLAKSRRNEKSIDEILADHVDPFFIDEANAFIDGTSGVLVGVFKADFFGECRISKDFIADVENDLIRMTVVAGEFFERRMTECASHGAVTAAERPVEIPVGFVLQFTPSEDA